MPYFTVKYLWLVELSFPICFFKYLLVVFKKKNASKIYHAQCVVAILTTIVQKA